MAKFKFLGNSDEANFGWDSLFDWKDYSEESATKERGSSKKKVSLGNVSNILDRFLGSEDSGWADFLGSESGGAGAESGDGGFLSNLFGGSGEGGEGTGGIGTAAYVIAAIIGQHAATNSNPREVEGVETGDAFSGQFATEPWFAWISEQWGFEPTAGEKFDAAVKNADQDEAWQRLPAALDYWANPIDNWIAAPFKEQWGDLGGWLFDPIGTLLAD